MDRLVLSGPVLGQLGTLCNGQAKQVDEPVRIGLVVIVILAEGSGLLQDVPADVLKIDRGFLNRDMADRKNVMIIKGIVNIANILHLKTVCEGVETGAQKELLKGIGCDLAQGYYYAKPMEREKMEALLFIRKELA